MLRSAGVGHAVSDGPWIARERLYDRLAEIGRWAEVLKELSGQVREIYGFYNNHYEGHSPASACGLLQRLGQPVIDPDELDPQRSLF